MDIAVKQVTDGDVLELFSLYDDFMLGFLGEDSCFYTRYNGGEGLEAVWCAYLDSFPVGCIAYRKKGERAGEVKRLFVREGYRGQKISRMLLEAVERRARGQGCHTLFLDTRATLEPAASLYSSMGFRVVFQDGLYIQMEKPIVPAHNGIS